MAQISQNFEWEFLAENSKNAKPLENQDETQQPGIFAADFEERHGKN